MNDNDLVLDTFGTVQRQAAQQATSDIDASPDDAQRAIELSQTIGVHPAVIADSLESYERDHKAALASNIIKSNSYISDYIASHPMASRISNDDYGQLDTASQSISKIASDDGVISSAIKGFKEGFGEGGVGSWMLDSPGGAEFVKQNRLSAATMSVLASPVEITFRTLSGAIKGATDAAYAGGKSAYRTLGGSESQSDRFGRDVAGMVEMLTAAPTHLGAPHVTPEAVAKARETMERSKPWVDAGKEPPYGVDPIIDQVKEKQSDLDLKNLDEALKESVKSATRDRSPELYANFVRQHTDAKISISGEAVAKLYGDKLPEVDDGKLGWIPRLREQMETAIATGGDIEVPIADWLARVEPELHKELHDDLRVRPGGVTKNEVKALREARADVEVKPEPVEEPTPVEGQEPQPMVAPIPEEPKVIPAVEGTRAQASFEPLFTKAQALEKEDLGAGIEATVKPSEAYTAHEKLIVERVQKTLARIAPELTDVRTVPKIEMDGREIGGVYITTEQAMPLVAVSLNARDAGKTARHEAIHFLRDFGFFKPEEWSALEDAAKGWQDKHRIGERYSRYKRDSAEALEEAIAEEFGEWGSTTEAPRKHLNEAVQSAFEKMAKFFNEILQAMKELFGHAPTIDELFEKIESGEVGNRADVFTEVRPEDVRTQQIDVEALKAEREKLRDERAPWLDRQLAAEQIGDMVTAEAAKKEYDAISERINELNKQIPTKTIEKNMFVQSPQSTHKITFVDKEPELPQSGTTRMEDREPFSGSFPGWMTMKQRQRYMELIAQRNAEDVAALEKKIASQLEQTKSKEWRDNRASVHDEVTRNLEDRPDVAADRYMRTGELYGEKGARPKLGTEYLSDEQISSLPEDWVAEGGLHPDDLAGLFGYPTGASMVEALGKLSGAREQAGMSPAAYLKRVADVEADKVMQERYGQTPDEVLEAAKDHVLSQTQMDLLHEQTYALATKAGLEFSLTKDQLKAAVQKAFGETPLESISSTRLLADAGRAGKLMEAAFLKDDAAEAFRQSQRQYLAGLMGREAVRLEKERAQFDRFAKRFGKREVAGVQTEYKDFIQQLLYQAERPGQRSLENINETIERAGYKNLQDFVEDRRDYGWDLEVADWLQAQGAKSLETMSVNEFRDFNKSLKSMAFVGRAEKKIVVGGDSVDFDDWKKTVRQNIQTLPLRTKEKQGKLLYQADASLTRMEEIVRDLDLRRELGPLHKALIQPMMDGKHTEYLLQEALSKKLAAMKAGSKEWMRTLGDVVENDSLIDPDTGAPFEIKRSDMINIMLNFGNRGNIEKFTKGWLPSGLDKAARAVEAQKLEAKLWEMIHKHAKAEDWKFAQSIWDIFGGWQDKIGTVYHNLSGLVPEWVKAEPIKTAHGDFDGGYFPIIYDSHYSDINRIRESKGDVLDPKNYIRATTGNGFARERTGYIDRVEFQNTIDALPTRMQQVMHDISYRAAVVQANKIIQDREIRGLIRKHYGNEYEAQLLPWLKDIANHYNQNEAANAFMNTIMKKARMNLSAHALGLNLKVIGSPDVGTLNPAAIARTLSNYDSSVKLAWEKSKEIPHSYRNMDRDFRERLENLIVKNGWDNFQATAVRWAFIPLVKVSQGFRIVTFVDEYKKSIAKGMSDADAADFADQQVRLRHGATGIPDLPAAMRGSEGMKMATMFYGFFNAMYNWQRRVKGDVKRGNYKNALEDTWGAVVVPAIFGALLFNKPSKDDKIDSAASWGKQSAKAVSLQVLGTLPFVRDLGSAIIEGIRPSTPIGSLFQSLGNAVTDVNNARKGKRVQKPISHAANVVGLSTGLPLAQIGRTSQFGYDVAKGYQRPKNFFEWYRGIINGEYKLH